MTDEKDARRRPSYEEVLDSIDAVISAVRSDSEREEALYERMTEIVRSAVLDHSLPPEKKQD